jgi:hypothetical protein
MNNIKMDKKITCFIPYSGEEPTGQTIRSLESSGLAAEVHKSENITSVAALRKMDGSVKTEYILIYTKQFTLDIGRFALDRMMQISESTGTGMVYSDYFENKEGKLSAHPLIDYQEGSLRDDFNFGSVVLYKTSAFRSAVKRMSKEFKYAGLYDLRLKISQESKIVHIPELLYTEVETDTRKSGEKQFDYVDPRNREVQIEMELACTDHLKAVGGWMKPEFRKIAFDSDSFDYEASVIIPVKNRVKTIGDAINSILTQKTDFKFNVIVVDNYSSDGTTDILRTFSANDKRVIHFIPDRKDLGIGGCWNEGIFNEGCGKFVIQLDSDDLYIDNSVIAKIVDAFYVQQCAMVVGSYRMVNFKLEDIPPGIIDHKEWTPENGRNNALRINGLGAPRAFYTPVLRDIKIPNVSYGEDYAVGLAISRHYQIGRIYEPLYLCRRWDENSDAALDVSKMNAHNLYKDRIRTIELLARKKMNHEN